MRPSELWHIVSSFVFSLRPSSLKAVAPPSEDTAPPQLLPASYSMQSHVSHRAAFTYSRFCVATAPCDCHNEIWPAPCLAFPSLLLPFEGRQPCCDAFQQLPWSTVIDRQWYRNLQGTQQGVYTTKDDTAVSTWYASVPSSLLLTFF